MSEDSIGDRMKVYESQHDAKLIPLLPVFARLDGKSFHTFTRHMRRPFDEGFSALMPLTARHLLEESHAILAYTQSDEITLLWESTDYKSQIYFDGRVSKMNSVLAASASVHFNHHASLCFGNYSKPGLFDCRAWNVPNRTEAVNCLVWREQDATRNSIQMAAQSVFSHKELYGKSCDELQEMLFQKGINWNDYPTHFKRGTYIVRRVLDRPFTAAEIESLPPKHNARTNPDLVVKRTITQELHMPPLARIANREAVIFESAEPVAAESKGDAP